MVDYWMFKVHGNDKLEDTPFGGPVSIRNIGVVI
jgi:hypothetical protein